MNKQPKYVSCYKIDGVPILPPLMTDQRRLEMRNYREMAVAKEQRQLSVRSQGSIQPELPPTKDHADVPQLPLIDREETVSSIDQELCKYLNLTDVHAGNVTSIEPDVSDEVNSRYMQISSMLSHTKEFNSEPNVKDPELTLFELHPKVSSANNTCAEANEIIDTDCVVAKADSLSDIDCATSMQDYVTVNEINSTIATNGSDQHTLVEKVLPESLPPRLIRSNSYTLDGPSPLFLIHHSQQVAFESERNNKLEPACTALPKQEPTKTASKVSLTRKSASVVKPRKSSLEQVYGVKLPVRAASVGNRKANVATVPCSIDPPSKGGRTMSAKNNDAKSKTQHNRVRNIYDPKPKTATQSPLQRQLPVATPRISRPQEESLIEFITQMEHNRKQQMDLLIERQEIEQRKMQETFKREQELLIKQITDNCSNMLNSYQIETVTMAKDMISAAQTTTEGNDKNFRAATVNNFVQFSAAQFLTVSAGAVEENNNNPVISKTEHSVNVSAAATLKSSAHRKLFSDTEQTTTETTKCHNDDLEQKAQAATIINACARGYLTRRLFKTEDVQTVVKIIQDTLLFIIDLHHENHPAGGEADINLKRSLINQLNSSCYLLHDIFFGKSIAERMDIIFTDRKMLKKKFSQSRAFNMHQAPPVSSRNSLNKLAKVVLFPIDIPSHKIQKFSQSLTILRNSKCSAVLPTRPHSS